MGQLYQWEPFIEGAVSSPPGRANSGLGDPSVPPGARLFRLHQRLSPDLEKGGVFGVMGGWAGLGQAGRGSGPEMLFQL